MSETPMAISSNQFSFDTQVYDALEFLRTAHPKELGILLKAFPEAANPQWVGSWLDTDTMGVDQEFTSWLCDAIEDTDHVYWEDGEPWTLVALPDVVEQAGDALVNIVNRSGEALEALEAALEGAEEDV